jgi:monoamine oxidase
MGVSHAVAYIALTLCLLEGRPAHAVQRLRGCAAGNIHFAGEHCSINFQGFMEGGVEEGVRAANEILTDSRIPL